MAQPTMTYLRGHTGQGILTVQHIKNFNTQPNSAYSFYTVR